jgi:hypothetical protein
MHRAYRGQLCLGGGRDWLSPANPDAAAGDGHLHDQTRPGLSTSALYRAKTDGQSRSVTVSCETNAHRNRRSARLSSADSLPPWRYIMAVLLASAPARQ